MSRRVALLTLVAAIALTVGVVPASGDVPALITLAGTGVAGFSGDDGPATAAQLDTPAGVAVDADGNIYISDALNDRIRRVDRATGEITTIAGDGTPGATGDGGPAASARLYYPEGLAMDADGNLYIADSLNHKIRMIDADTGDISTVVGTGTGSSTGDGDQATLATINFPTAVAIGGDGNLYIAELDGRRVRKVDLGTGEISTVAGVGTAGFSGDGDDATLAELDGPQGVAADASGNVFIADTNNHRIRRVDVTTGEIDTIAGDGTAASTGDDGDAASAQVNFAMGLVLDADDNLYFFENTNGKVRRIDAVTNVITSVIPSNLGYLSGPYQGAIDTEGNLFIAEGGGHTVSVFAVSDGDGDGFPDVVDNFPEVYSKCRTSQATIVGDDDPNILNGTSGADVIVGLGGADTINGLEGDDLICAGNGADYITGGDGKDKIYADNGADTVFGNEMSDRIYGGDGNDTLYGNGGTRDRLFGGDGTDVLDGGTGTDDRCTLGETYVGTTCETVF